MSLCLALLRRIESARRRETEGYTVVGVSRLSSHKPHKPPPLLSPPPFSAASPRRSSRLASLDDEAASASPTPPALWRDAGLAAALAAGGGGDGGPEKAAASTTTSAQPGRSLRVAVAAGSGATAPRPPLKVKRAVPRPHSFMAGPLGIAAGGAAMALYIGAIFFVAGSAGAALVAGLALHPAWLLWLAVLGVLAAIPLRDPGPWASAFTRFSMGAAGRYFDLTVEYEDETSLTPGRPYVLAYSPHSALPVGLPVAFCELSPGCSPVWGRVRTLASSTVSEKKREERERRERVERKGPGHPQPHARRRSRGLGLPSLHFF